MNHFFSRLHIRFKQIRTADFIEKGKGLILFFSGILFVVSSTKSKITTLDYIMHNRAYRLFTLRIVDMLFVYDAAHKCLFLYSISSEGHHEYFPLLFIISPFQYSNSPSILI